MLSSKVLIVGAGGLGCPVALYLAGAGVGTIGVLDYDEVFRYLKFYLLASQHSHVLNK